MLRLFVGLDLPAPQRELLAALAGGLPGARWVPPENYHLTLRFIGATPRHVAEEIDHALAGLRLRPFELTFGGLGSFAKGGRATQLWVGTTRCEPLDRLAGKIDTALTRLGLPAERRRFVPHVAIARLDNVAESAAAGFIARHNLFTAPPMMVDHFVLFSSRLGKERSVYTAEVAYELT
jgi:2'-5' RNA ligase